MFKVYAPTFLDVLEDDFTMNATGDEHEVGDLSCGGKPFRALLAFLCWDGTEGHTINWVTANDRLMQSLGADVVNGVTLAAWSLLMPDAGLNTMILEHSDGSDDRDLVVAFLSYWGVGAVERYVTDTISAATAMDIDVVSRQGDLVLAAVGNDGDRSSTTSHTERMDVQRSEDGDAAMTVTEARATDDVMTMDHTLSGSASSPLVGLSLARARQLVVRPRLQRSQMVRRR